MFGGKVMITGITIIVVFFVFAVLMMTRKIPALLALPFMAIIFGIIAGLSLTGDEGIIDFVVVNGALRLASTYVAILFSCWLAQIMYRTGVTDTIIKKAAELGGDKPLIVALALSAVTIFLFTTLHGTGAVAMVGTIVLPIFLTIGIPARESSNLYLAAVSAGYTLNPANISALLNVSGCSAAELNLCAIVLTVGGCIFTLLYCIWVFKRYGKKAAFSASANTDENEEQRPTMVKGVRGFLACMTPFIVVAITLIFKINALAVFFIGVLWIMIMTFNGKWSSYVSMIVQSFYEGFKEGAPAAGLMMGIGMLLNAVAAPTMQTVIAPFMTAITPTTAIGLIIFASLLCPLSLYRGPFNFMGLGAGLMVSMMAVGSIPTAVLAAVFYAASRWPSQACPTATQVVWSANFVGLDPVSSTNQVQIVNWIFTAITIVVLTILYF